MLITIISIAISICSACVAIYALKSNLRGEVYKRQVETYFMILDIMLQLEKEAFVLISRNWDKDSDEYWNIVDKWDNLEEKLEFEIYKSELIMPEKIFEEMEKMEKVFFDISKGLNNKNYILKPEIVVETIYSFQDVIRKELSIEEHSRNNRNTNARFQQVTLNRERE